MLFSSLLALFLFGLGFLVELLLVELTLLSGLVDSCFFSTGFKASAWNISRDSRPTATEIAALAAAGTPVGANTTVAYEKIGSGILYVSADTNTFDADTFNGKPTNFATVGPQIYSALRALVLNS